MATLNATFSLSSTDLFDSVNVSKTVSKALTIDGDNRQGLTVVKTADGADLSLTIENLSGSTGGTKKAYFYAKNLDSTDTLIFKDDGDAVFAKLSPGEFMFFPSAANDTIKVRSSANTPLCEYLLLEVD
tara:strand:+ start:1230 stop:1616 length:387 start_codon:yes stop_codon:yes gene_type:complete